MYHAVVHEFRVGSARKYDKLLPHCFKTTLATLRGGRLRDGNSM